MRFTAHQTVRFIFRTPASVAATAKKIARMVSSSWHPLHQKTPSPLLYRGSCLAWVMSPDAAKKLSTNRCLKRPLNAICVKAKKAALRVCAHVRPVPLSAYRRNGFWITRRRVSSIGYGLDVCGNDNSGRRTKPCSAQRSVTMTAVAT